MKQLHGMPAAHSIGFKHGGLITLQEEYLRLRRKAVDGYIATQRKIDWNVWVGKIYIYIYILHLLKEFF